MESALGEGAKPPYISRILWDLRLEKDNVDHALSYQVRIAPERAHNQFGIVAKNLFEISTLAEIGT